MKDGIEEMEGRYDDGDRGDRSVQDWWRQKGRRAEVVIPWKAGS
jgi:hypothetical protein